MVLGVVSTGKKMSDPTFDSGFIVWSLFVVAVVGYACYQGWQKRLRERELRAYLEEQSFARADVPGYLPLSQLQPKLGRGYLKNGYVGTFNRCSAFVGDVQIGQGKGSYCQTFVAVERKDTTPYVPPAFLTTLSFEYYQHERWVLGTVSKQTLGVDAVEGFLRCFT
jgi:hypothetical protein